MQKIKEKQLRKNRNKKITFGIYEYTVNDNGFKTKEFIEKKQVFAHIRNLRGREFYAAKAVNAENTVVFNTLFFKNLNENWLIKMDEEIYKIEHIDNINLANFEYDIKAVNIKQKSDKNV